MRAFRDLQGRETGLGRCLGRGGEGAVYSVPMWPRSVAKLYARRPDDRASRKLGAMVQLATGELAAVAAWPENLLLDPDTGDTVGFLMPRVEDHREIHALYGPTNRKTAFPDASWAFLVRAARNVAAAFDAVHQHGLVIGDVNQGNVVVSRQATVRLIDCDSFQITHLGRTYPCRVGVPLFTPPELQGRRLDGVVRSADHDRFGLAVLVFQLLFMGRHPFAGRHPERAIPVEAAIREGLFAFGRDAARQGWEPPPFSLGLDDVSPELAGLFERAFGGAAAAGGPRPTAAEWVAALDQIETRLRICGDDPRHVHAGGEGACPWCRLEQGGGPSFFFLAPGAAPDAFDLVATWRSIEAVRPPGPAPALPEPPVLEDPAEAALPASALGTLRRLCIDLMRGLDRRERLRQQADRRREIARCEANLHRIESQWPKLCSDLEFTELRRRLERAKADYQALPALEKREQEELVERFRERRLQPHLESFPLEFARIPGLGRAEVGRLTSFGIRTAADVSAEALMAIPDVDWRHVRSLLLFKGVATRSFQFDPVTGVPGRDRKALADAQGERRGELTETLRTGAVGLAERRRLILAWRDTLGRAYQDTRRRIAELEADAGSQRPPRREAGR